ncbi:MAG: Omp28-related outer membrane protein [Ignavibacteriaceae bacterium]|nr:Omp28-related outer membrane protein [Ignavibacteriaceae bacterium]
MKKIFTVGLLFIVFVLGINAQSGRKNSDELTSGFKRYPLFEEVTNASCGPCASSNPVLNAFIEQMSDSLIAITYHAWWPGVSDPMYQHNIQQNRDRIQFMKGNVNATPWLNVDGVIVDVWPFNSTNLIGAYNTRMAVMSPLGLEVTHTRISVDTVEVRVKAALLSDLPAGSWKLRVYAVEHPINYATAPGSNGERFFPHVFRKSVPGSVGEIFPTTAGNYEFVYRYKFEPAWNDTNLYSIAVVQEDNTKEVVNTGSSKFTNILPVELASFEALQQKNGILVSWSTATELNNFGFEIEKSYDGVVFTTEAFVNGKGTSTDLTHYSHFMELNKNGAVSVRLKQIDLDGSVSYSRVETVEFGLLPTTVMLFDNYPNPFNPSTTISYALPEATDITLSVYNTLGELVKVLDSGFKPEGNHKMEFKASELPSGVYLLTLNSPIGNSVKKINLLK